MSTQYKRSHEVPTAVLAKRLDELSDAVIKRDEERDRELTMRIPAELDRDADLVLYEAAQRLVKLEAERDALAALCGAAAVVLERTANDTLDGRNMARRLRGVSDTTLARLKAQWQAEGAQLTADSIRYKYEGEIHQDRIADHADEVAEQLRRQAEEATLAGRKG